MSHPYYDDSIDIIKKHRDQVSRADRSDPNYSGNGYDALALSCALADAQKWYEAYQELKRFKNVLKEIRDEE
jgi:hypothetical protein